MKKLSIIFVNYNVCYFIEQAIKSVYAAAKDIDLEIFVVDNNSIDNSVDLIKEKFPDVILIANKDNKGFSKANNQAMKLATGEYVLLLNPDTVVEEDTLRKCCDFMDEHPDAGALGVKMLDGKGNFLPESKRGLPTPWVAFYKISGLASIFKKSKKFGRYHLSYLDKDDTNEIEILAGAFMFMRKEALDKVGLLDEDYFMYGEDIDLSYRIIKGGYKNYYFPDTRIIHYKGESTKKTSVNYVFIFYRAMIIFARKHFSQKNAKAFSVLINVAIYLKAGLDIFRNLLKGLTPSMLDFSMIWGGMFLAAHYWERQYKPTENPYPEEYFTLVIPLYVFVWLASIYFNGGHDRPHSLNKIFRGILIGTLVISASSNFVDEYRFSKALILIGAGLTLIAFTLNRLVIHFFKHNNFRFSTDKVKQVAIVGFEDESNRVMSLLKKLNANVVLKGFITPGYAKKRNDMHLGEVRQIDEIIEIHDINELIFCSKDINTNIIIGFMTNIKNKFVDYKIVPTDSNYIIGSNSKNAQGDLYTIEIKLNITKKENIRNKRVFDVVFSLLCLGSLPLSIWFVQKKGRFFLNIFEVFFGKKSWVGFSFKKDLSLPVIRSGVLTPANSSTTTISDPIILKQLDTLYAREYSVIRDISIIRKGFKELGNA